MVRHLATLVAAVIIAPIAWVLLALGQDRSAQLFSRVQATDTPPPTDFLVPLVFLIVAGALLGLLGTLRVSPLGATLIGIGYLGSYIAALVAPGRLISLLDHTLSIAGHQANLATPVRTGATAVLGSLLLVAVFSVRRWRRWPRPVEAAPDSILPDPFLPAEPSTAAEGPGPLQPTRIPEPDWAATGPRHGTSGLGNFP